MGNDGNAYLRIRLTDEVSLVAEIDVGSHIMPYKEIFIGLERDGVWFQDLAIVREKYHYEDAECDESVVVPDHGKYEVLVYSDECCGDYTHKFVISEYSEV